MGNRERKLVHARNAAAAVNFQTEVGLTGDAKYASMAKTMGMFAKEEKSAWQWHSRLKVINGWYGGFRVGFENGRRVVSHATDAEREKRLYQSFASLWKLGYRIDDPKNIKAAHVEALVKLWTGQIPLMGETELNELSPKTIENRLSALRQLCKWLGKKDVVKPKAFYATESHPLICTGITKEDKSWEGADIDYSRVMREAVTEDPAVAIQMVAMSAFGLRMREAVMLDVFEAERIGSLYITKGTKGGRKRSVEITNGDQRLALDLIKDFAKTRPGVHHLGSLGLDFTNPRDLLQALNHSYYIFGKIGITKKTLGVTVHGLRHQFCHELMLSLGLIPAVKGGSADQMPKQERTRIERIASEALGHSRPGITAAYAGSFHRKPEQSFNQKDINDDPR